MTIVRLHFLDIIDIIKYFRILQILTICALMTTIIIFNTKVENVALAINGQRTTKMKITPFISNLNFEELNRINRSSAIVLPQYKLIFFWHAKTACSYWKRVFQYIQGIPRGQYKFYIHTPERSGLRYIYDYSATNISLMMHDDTWIKATFVREPRERILSAYLDKAVDNTYVFDQCNRSVESFKAFMELIQTCHDPHWESQVTIPEHYYNNMMIGYITDTSAFTEKLLKTIGAWNSTVEQWLNKRDYSDLGFTRVHATNSKEKILQYYTPDLEKQILNMFKRDYEVFGFNQSLYTTSNTNNT